jgi:hypothetical protein
MNADNKQAQIEDGSEDPITDTDRDEDDRIAHDFPGDEIQANAILPGQADEVPPIPQDMIPGPLNPLPGPVDFTKPLRTKGGKQPVRIIAIDYSLRKPIIGVLQATGFDKEVSCWTSNGQYNPAGTSEFLDLENVPAREAL